MFARSSKDSRSAYLNNNANRDRGVMEEMALLAVMEAQLRVVAVETEKMEEMEEIVVAVGKTAVMEEVMEDLLEKNIGGSYSKFFYWIMR